MNSTLSAAYLAATPVGGNRQARPNQHTPVRMEGNPRDALMAQAIREEILDSAGSYEKTESGILLSARQDDGFIIRPAFEIHRPCLNSGILLARS